MCGAAHEVVLGSTEGVPEPADRTPKGGLNGAPGIRVRSTFCAGRWFDGTLPLGSIAVPLCGSYLRSSKVIPKRNYNGAYGYAQSSSRACSSHVGSMAKRSLEASQRMISAGIPFNLHSAYEDNDVENSWQLAHVDRKGPGLGFMVRSLFLPLCSVLDYQDRSSQGSLYKTHTHVLS